MPKKKTRQHVPCNPKKRRGEGKKPSVETTCISDQETIDMSAVLLDHAYLLNDMQVTDNQETVAEQFLYDENFTIDEEIETEIVYTDSFVDLETGDCVILDDCYDDKSDEPISVEPALEPVFTDSFEKLKYAISDIITSPYTYLPNGDSIQILEMYPSLENLSVKLSITITREFTAKIFVHRIELSSDHDFWIGLPKVYDNVSSVNKLLSKLRSYTVCCGNHEKEFLDLTPVGSTIEHATDSDSNCRGYREQDFGAVKGTLSYSSTIRNINCSLLVQGNRCGVCVRLRRMLITRKHRLEEKRRKSDSDIDTPNYLSKNYRHCNMSREELILKISQQRTVITTLQNQIAQTQRQFQRDLAGSGVTLNACQSEEMRDAMALCSGEMEKAFPDANCFQRLFWSEQFKSINVKSSKGMRWHPMVIRWCLYMRQKSSAAYDAMRDSGFITLPSARTLFDYSHYTKCGNGYQLDVLKLLRSEAEKRDMYKEDEPWRKYVGVLFDEIQIKSDLIYDKYSGELIGYCNLDKVGNQMMTSEKAAKGSEELEIAKYMLVVMVRGATCDLRFPLAAFPTASITADFLYPIIWKAVRVIETGVVDLRVLFITCDGASANRRFFKLHGNDNDFIHYAINPYSTDNSKIYFVSDVPHLVKTTRNCFCNSYSHRNTRKMWKDGKDISWLHILNLFEHHCELSLYNPCPKLTRRHIDMSSFGCMKVNLAAQVLSSSVANALEMLYGDYVSETVNFIRTMNKFFDCLNVRNLYEGRNKRNPDLNAYNDVNDERLRWLKEDFLNYFEAWEQLVMARAGNFTQKERKGMMLSHQTLTGLKISVFSIVESVKELINGGAKFVLTSVFNQDPLEQQFGNYRHKSGDNSNPTVYEVRNAMNQMRAVGAVALAPKRGNARRGNDENRCVIDNSKLPKRQSP